MKKFKNEKWPKARYVPPLKKTGENFVRRLFLFVIFITLKNLNFLMNCIFINKYSYLIKLFGGFNKTFG